VLTGKYRPGQAPPSDSRAANSDMNVAMDRLMDDAVLEAVDRLRPVADQAGLSMAELALAWVLRRPELASAIVGASRPRAGPRQRQGLGHCGSRRTRWRPSRRHWATRR
jgi:aryl-alcohol dehydrogenase-like predicted oxidoreductase